MKILMVVTNFPPEIGSTSHLYYDLSRALTRRGHEVSVITSYPRKYLTSSDLADHAVPMEEIQDGLEILRVKHTSFRDSSIMRGVEQFVLPLMYLWRLIRTRRKFDAIIINIPPLALSWFARMVRFMKGTPSILNIQDFHPQELVDIGYLNSGSIISILERLERSTYVKADYITVLSSGGVDYVISKGADPSRVEHIYNSFDQSTIRSTGDGTEFRTRYGIEERALVSYAGILSPFQNVGCILDVSPLLSSEDIRFVIAGNGMMRDEIQGRIDRDHLKNVTMFDYLPKDAYYALLNASDICLVTLDERMKAPCIPGKVVSIMSMGRPILALVDPGSETAKLVHEAGCGRVVAPGDKMTIAATIREMLADKDALQAMGENAKAFVKRNMDLDDNAAKYERIILSLKKSSTS